METNKIYNYIEFDYENKIDNQKSNDTRNSFNKSILFNISNIDFDELNIFLVVLTCFYALLSIFTITNNSIVLWIIHKNKQMRNTTNYFICNLAFADIIIGVFVSPFQFQAAYLQKWIFPRIMCKIAPFASTLSVNVSIFTLIAISLDRYRYVFYPFNRKLKMNGCIKILLIIWFISIILSLVKLFNFDVENDIENNVLTCGPLNKNLHKYETILIVIIQYFGPSILLSFIYIRIGCRFIQNKFVIKPTRNSVRRKNQVYMFISHHTVIINVYII